MSVHYNHSSTDDYEIISSEEHSSHGRKSSNDKRYCKNYSSSSDMPRRDKYSSTESNSYEKETHSSWMEEKKYIKEEYFGRNTCSKNIQEASDEKLKYKTRDRISKTNKQRSSLDSCRKKIEAEFDQDIHNRKNHIDEYDTDDSTNYFRGKDYHRSSSSSRSTSPEDFYGQYKTCRNNNETDQLSDSRGSKISNYKSHIPNRTICIKGLSKYISEVDIQKDIQHCGLKTKDIRIIRDKGSGASRGLAFVEFYCTENAVQWIEDKNGIFKVGSCSAFMEFANSNKAQDWICGNCNSFNFSKRYFCYKCFTARTCTETEEISNNPTKTLMLLHLDALTTEDSLRSVLEQKVPHLIHAIVSVCISRDNLTSISKGTAYVIFENIYYSMSVFDLKSFIIDGKIIQIFYCKFHAGDKESEYTKLYSSIDLQKEECIDEDLNFMIDYNAGHYAKTLVEYLNYYQYYKKYFQDKVTEIAANSVGPSPKYNLNNIPDGLGQVTYEKPKTNKYVYDKYTGYFFDFDTALYYDKNSGYYYNNMIQKFLYWDEEKNTYLIVPTKIYNNLSNQNENLTKTVFNNSYLKPKFKSLKNKSETPKKIMKNMERWAKKLNENKTSSCEPSTATSTEKPEFDMHDIGYNVLLKTNLQKSIEQAAEKSNVLIPSQECKVGSDKNLMKNIIDFENLICNLCKRKFISKEHIWQHIKLSQMHVKNLLFLSKRKNEDLST